MDDNKKRRLLNLQAVFIEGLYEDLEVLKADVKRKDADFVEAEMNRIMAQIKIMAQLNTELGGQRIKLG